MNHHIQGRNSLFNNTLFVNITSLGLVQLANYAIPILIIPYVVRALGTESFGAACYAQNIIFYLTLIVNYGFEYSATQEVAIHKDNPTELRRIFWNVIYAKSILLAVSFSVLAILYVVMPQVHADPVAYIATALINVGYVFFPSWFFQGVEKMARMSFFTFCVKFIGAIFTVLLVHNPGDYCLYLFSLSLAQIVAGVAGFWYIKRLYQLDFQAPDEILHEAAVKKGFPIFLNTAMVTSNIVVGVTIMGFFLSNEHVGIYSGAQKIIMSIMMVSSQPISIALFPRISRKFNESQSEGLAYLRKSLIYIALFSLLVSLVTYFAAPLMVGLLLGDAFRASIPLLRIMSILPFLVTIDTAMTVQGLYGMQLQKYAPFVGGTTCVASIVLNLLFIPRWGEQGIVAAWIICQCIDILLAVLLIMKKSKQQSKKIVEKVSSEEKIKMQ